MTKVASLKLLYFECVAHKSDSTEQLAVTVLEASVECKWYQAYKVYQRKVVPYSITSIGHTADPSFLAVSPQVT